MDHKTLIIIILGAIHVPLYVLWGWVLFRSWEDFWDAVCFFFKPEWWSLLDGEYWEDILAEAKLALWLFGPMVLFAFELRLLGLISQ